MEAPQIWKRVLERSPSACAEMLGKKNALGEDGVGAHVVVEQQLQVDALYGILVMAY